MLKTATAETAAALEQERITRVEAAVPAQPPPSAEAPFGGGYPAGTTATLAPAQPTATSGGYPAVEVKVEQDEAERSTHGAQERTPGPWDNLTSEVVVPKSEESADSVRPPVPEEPPSVRRRLRVATIVAGIFKAEEERLVIEVEGEGETAAPPANRVEEGVPPWSTTTTLLALTPH